MWIEFAAKHKVEDVIPIGFRLVTATTDDTVIGVLKLLKEHNLNSVPIFDPIQEKFIGFIGYLELITAILFMSAGKELVEVMSNREVDWLEYLLQEAKVLSEEKAVTFADLDKKTAFVTVNKDDGVAVLVEKLAHVRRVGVLENGNMVAVLSRSRLIEYLQKHLGAVAELGAFTVAEAGLDEQAKIFSVSAETEVGQAYQLMVENEITSLPVLNAEGHLKGCISASDLHGNTIKDVILGFSAPVGTYVEKFAHSKTVGGTVPVSCNKEDSLAHVLLKLANCHVNQLYVINAAGKVVSVLSLGDLIKTLRDAL